MSIDLGSERLMLTHYFGDDIETRLNAEDETNKAIIAARVFLSSGDKKHLIGTKVKLDDSTPKVKKAINSQMGLPDNFGWDAIGDSLVGRENDFMILILGFNNLKLVERIRLFIRLKTIGVQFALDE